jgi:hypothetical protein
MSFVGDLEHLPIVDVIQLLHATRKSGTLCLKSSKGESQLVFSDGCIVSANHSNNSVRIGQILVQMNKISPETLEATLAEQKKAGPDRVPLIASLIESGNLKKEDAFKGLETLIEMTIVEVLTWTEGTFELDVDTTVISDEYRYIPENLKLELNLNTQNVLMDALRIYDEKKRDGTLMEETFPGEAPSFESPAEFPASSDNRIISIDDLGLDVMDDLEKVIPGFFTPVKVQDPTFIHREKTGASLDNIPQEQQEQLFAYLSRKAAGSTGQESDHSAATTHALILFSDSEFTRHTVMTACKHEGFFTFSTDEEENLNLIINQSLSKELLPVILLDPPEGNPGLDLNALTGRVLSQYPEIAIFHLTGSADFTSILNAMHSGARAVIPKPDIIGQNESFAEDTIYFLETLKKCLKVAPPKFEAALPDFFRECINEIVTKKELTEITAVIDRYISSVMARAITFVSRRSELVCDSISRSASSQPLTITIPAGGDSPIHKAISSGTIFSGEGCNPLLTDSIYSQIGPPANNQIVAVPFKCLGRVLAVTYGDFGPGQPSALATDIISILASFGGLVYENALYRKKFEKMLQSQH